MGDLIRLRPEPVHEDGCTCPRCDRDDMLEHIMAEDEALLERLGEED